MFDKNIFLSQRLADKNSELMDAYFTLNKKLDNLMDYLDIELVMSKLSASIHLIAHQAPLDADRFRDYNALYSYRTKYGTIQGQFKDYANPVEGIADILSYLADMTNMLYDAKSMGKSEENEDYVKFINTEIEKIRSYKKQFILFHDKIQKSLECGNTVQDIDFYSSDYIIEVE